MDEIKFRAWDKIEKKYHYDILCDMAECDNWDNEITMWQIAKAMNEGDDTIFAFEQYTGHNNKKGKDVYEGDIFQASKENKCLMVIRWDKIECGFVVIYLKDKWHDKERKMTLGVYWCVKHCLPVGNINENKGLIKE